MLEAHTPAVTQGQQWQMLQKAALAHLAWCSMQQAQRSWAGLNAWGAERAVIQDIFKESVFWD